MKVLAGIILYLILFAKEYKKQTKAKSKEILRRNLLCPIFPKQLKKSVMIFALLTSLTMFYSPVYASCHSETACKISDLMIENPQNKELKQPPIPKVREKAGNTDKINQKKSLKSDKPKNDKNIKIGL